MRHEVKRKNSNQTTLTPQPTAEQTFTHLPLNPNRPTMTITLNLVSSKFSHPAPIEHVQRVYTSDKYVLPSDEEERKRLVSRSNLLHAN